MAPRPLGTLQDLIRGFAARGEAPALMSFTPQGVDCWPYDRLAQTVARLTAGFLAQGLRRGEAVAIMAPNSPLWIAMYLAIVNAGGAAMPLDDRTNIAEGIGLLAAANGRWLVTTAKHAAQINADAARQIAVVLVDGGPRSGPRWRPWDALLGSTDAAAPAPDPGDVAVIAHTSGTTGTPKAVPLTHANLLSNVSALLAEGLIRSGDRALLPLPLHHIYPMTIGLLTPLAAGAAIVLPSGVSGPELLTALRRGDVTHLVGVPRLYTALLDGIRAQLRARGRRLAALVLALAAGSSAVRRTTGVPVGRLLFRPLRRRLAPRLRLLVSGGAALDAETEQALEGFGWLVLSGYGLTETSPILAFNRRAAKRPGTAGRPLPGVSLRIANPGADGLGEIEARGASVFAGYRGDDAATRAAFTPDGWFRTGDLGLIDGDGYLHVAARVTETIVLPDGKKIFPEAVEAVYEESPFIQEIAVLRHEGVLVALVVPNMEAIRARGGARAEDLIRDELAARGNLLPPYQRVSGIAIAHEPLPRTQLGKPRRFLLPALYDRARAGRGPSEPAAISDADRALLATPAAARLWSWLGKRFPERPLSLDTSPQLDLGVDSLGWVNLSLELEHDLGLNLTEASISRILTLRDLLREASAAPDAASPRPTAPPVEIADPDRAGLGLRVLRRLLAAINWTLARGLFRLRVRGMENLPRRGPCLLCPNHTSYLDPFVLAAALPFATLRRTWWAGWTQLLFAGVFSRWFSRVAQIVPVDPDRAVASSLAGGEAVLSRGGCLVWFPEGARSYDGSLQRFLPGVGALLIAHPVPVLPVHIEGAFAAWPRSRRVPRLARVTVTIGSAIDSAKLAPEAKPGERPNAIAQLLQASVARLSHPSTG